MGAIELALEVVHVAVLGVAALALVLALAQAESNFNSQEALNRPTENDIIIL